MGKLTSETRWITRKSAGLVKSTVFDSLFLKYLEKTENKTCLEIGCVPGTYLAYVCKNFGYFPEGVDYVNGTEEITGETLRNNGINKYVVYKADFIEWKPAKRYDIVLSIGFIEHFSGSLERHVINKHIELLKPGGKLILTVPNFKYLQYPLHLFLNKKTLSEHNLLTMELSYYREIAKEHDLNIMQLGYHGGLFAFWMDDVDMGLNILKKGIYYLLRVLTHIVRGSILKKLNNRFLSPYIVFIAEKKNA